MNDPFASNYVFALTNPGAESVLKLEVRRDHPDWRPSYQHRGLVTFKIDRALTADDLTDPPACARRLCLSFGKHASGHEAREALTRMLGPNALVHEARFEDRKMKGIAPTIQRMPAIGEQVGTWVDLGDAGVWAGIHRHGPWLSPDPAGDGGCVMPDHSPSRAWLKLEEAIRFFGLNLTRRDVVVELGASPGGVVLALLDRSIPVIGVDPAKMAPVVMTSAITDRSQVPKDRPWFYHCQKPAALVSKRDLGENVTWFMSDMNQSPAVVLAECARFCRMARSIRNVLITLKLTDLRQIVDAQPWREQLAAMGFTTVRLQQLSVHHRECALLAMK